MNRARWYQLALVVAILVSMLPAITIPGWPQRRIDAGWIEAISTAWALLGAAALLRVELQRNRRDHLLEVASAYVSWEPEDEDDGLPSVYVNNYGRFPIQDVTIFGDFTPVGRGRSLIAHGYPLPVAPGGRRRVHSWLERDQGPFAGIHFELYFTGADGVRYKRMNGKLTTLTNG